MKTDLPDNSNDNIVKFFFLEIKHTNFIHELRPFKFLVVYDSVVCQMEIGGGLIVINVPLFPIPGAHAL